MIYAYALRKLYPSLKEDEDWRVEDHGDGKGPQIKWDTERHGPLPDEAALAQAAAEYEAEQQAAKTKRASAQADFDAITERDIDRADLPALREIVKKLLRMARETR